MGTPLVEGTVSLHFPFVEVGSCSPFTYPQKKFVNSLSLFVLGLETFVVLAQSEFNRRRCFVNIRVLLFTACELILVFLGVFWFAAICTIALRQFTGFVWQNPFFEISWSNFITSLIIVVVAGITYLNIKQQG